MNLLWRWNGSYWDQVVDWWEHFEIPTWQDVDRQALSQIGKMNPEQVGIMMVLLCVLGILFLRGSNRSTSP